ncbi:MAG: aldehyde:ferredoxin oxidoreductase [Candidatus Lokiarchaeota archaeon]|nr:aldehyde:ferredoxin oxidoreductase [Candidatus Lokiarchaeota archaeon]
MILSEMKYEMHPIEKGYNNRTLYVNLTTNEIQIKLVTQGMKETFTGGKGFDLWLMWNSLPKDRIVKWNDPENEICIASGPLSGTNFIPGSGKSIVTTISPLTGMIIDSNVGGFYGPFLKYSGFDAIEIQGKAKEEVVVFVDGENHVVRIETAENTPKYSHELTQYLTNNFSPEDNPADKYRVSVVSTGPAAGYTNWGLLNFSWYIRPREWASYKQAGRGGIGTVFKDKNIKALICLSPKKPQRDVGAANKDIARNSGAKHNKEIITNDPKQNQMRQIGTGHLPIIMNEYDLLPTENYRFGRHRTWSEEEGEFPYSWDVWKTFMIDEHGLSGCWTGCTIACSHFSPNHTLLTGPLKGQVVPIDGPEYETIAGCGSNWGVWDPKWILEVNFYCDTYGLDTISVGTGIAFVMECYESGILNKEITGGLELNFGNAEAAMELVHQMARGEGFGMIVGKGIRQMKKIFADNYGGDPQFLQDIGMEHKGLEVSEYMTKESIAQQGGYGFTLKGPQHDEAWLIFEDMVRKSIPTFEDKANALCWFPFFRTWFGLNGLCKLPWNDVQPPDNKDNPIKDENGELYRARIPKHVQFYADYAEGITGVPTTPEDLVKRSEVVYNFQRIFNIRQGHGLRNDDANFPYRGMGPVTPLEYESRKSRYDTQLKEILGIDPTDKTTEEKIRNLRKYREEQYTKLQNVVYEKRGWSKHGCPTIEKVKELGIDFEDVLKVIQPYQ